MTLKLIDSHCHIDGPEFDADRATVLTRARDAGISPIIAVGTGPDRASIRRAIVLAEAEPDVFATVGVHPHEAARFPGLGDEIADLALHPRVVAIGEIGLDFHYDHSPRAVQLAVFRKQIQLAKRLGMPIVCHIRNAHDEALAILEEERPDPPGVIHCFTGDPTQAARYVALGWMVSFSGIVSFPGRGADPIREAVKVVPRDRLLIETDAPFLAPVPMRGRRNEPAFLVHTANVIALVSGLALEELAKATVANTSALFRLTP